MTRLEEIRGRWTAATPGPWFAVRYYVGAGEDQGDPDAEIATAGSKTDAAAIAHAPADIAALTAAVEGALALHKPHTEQVITGDCSEETCDHEETKDCPKIPYEVCDACWRVAEESDPYFGERGMEAVAYPCPTVTAINTALDSQP